MVIILSGVITGTVIAFILNKILANKLENKTQKYILKGLTFFVCIILFVGFFGIGSLRRSLENFIIGKINTINTSVSLVFPNINILELDINSNEFLSISNQLQEITDNLDLSNSSFIERRIYNDFSQRLIDNINMIQRGVDTSLARLNIDGIVSLNSILYNIKNMVMRRVSPFIFLGQVVTMILLLMYIGIYVGVYYLLKKLRRKYS